MGLELTRNDLLDVSALMEECQERWYDPVAWQEHLVERARALIGSDFCAFQLSHGTDAATVAFREGTITGRQDAAVERLFCEHMREGAAMYPMYPQPARDLVRDGWCTATFAEHLAAANYPETGQHFVERFHRPVAVTHSLHAACVVMPGWTATLSAMRTGRARDYSGRQRDLATAISAAITARCNSRLALATQHTCPTLAPRERDVLSSLLEGDSEKQVAARLQLSAATVHEYVGALYRRFAVHSRGELMAIFLRRAPALRASDDPPSV